MSEAGRPLITPVFKDVPAPWKGHGALGCGLGLLGPILSGHELLLVPQRLVCSFSVGGRAVHCPSTIVWLSSCEEGGQEAPSGPASGTPCFPRLRTGQVPLSPWAWGLASHGQPSPVQTSSRNSVVPSLLSSQRPASRCHGPWEAPARACPAAHPALLWPPACLRHSGVRRVTRTPHPWEEETEVQGSRNTFLRSHDRKEEDPPFSKPCSLLTPVLSLRS